MKTEANCATAVVATVTQERDLTYLEAANPANEQLGFDVLEFRLDNLHDQPDSQIFDLQKKWRSSHRILSTARHPAEGGHGELDETQRIKNLEASLASSDLIDTEIRSLDSLGMQKLVTKAQQLGVEVVASYHNFECYPSLDLLSEQVAKAFELGADVAKLAVVIESHSQLSELVKLVEQTQSAGNTISAMGMGPLGKLSRLVLASAGSYLNYGYLNEANAPGQWPAVDLRHLLDELQNC